MNSSYSDKLDAKAGRIKDEFLRSCFLHTAKRKALPRDCVVDGAIDRMIGIILKLEKDAERATAADHG